NENIENPSEKILKHLFGECQNKCMIRNLFNNYLEENKNFINYILPLHIDEKYIIEIIEYEKIICKPPNNISTLIYIDKFNIEIRAIKINIYTVKEYLKKIDKIDINQNYYFPYKYNIIFNVPLNDNI